MPLLLHVCTPLPQHTQTALPLHVCTPSPSTHRQHYHCMCVLPSHTQTALPLHVCTPLPHTHITTTACVTVPVVGITNVTSGSLYMASDTSVGGPCVEYQFVLHREGGGPKEKGSRGHDTRQLVWSGCTSKHQTHCSACLHNPASHN